MDDHEHEATGERTQATGHPAVDAVLASLRDLEQRPVSEQVTVFEGAHEALRSALAGAGDEAAAGQPEGGSGEVTATDVSHDADAATPTD